MSTSRTTTRDSSTSRVAACSVPELLRHAVGSHVPTLALEQAPGALLWANDALASYLRRPISALAGLPLSELCAEPERLVAVISRAAESGALQLVHDLGYVDASARTLFGTTLVQPLTADPRWFALYIVDGTELMAARAAGAPQGDLQDVNEKLVLSGLREHELAEGARLMSEALAQMLARRTLALEVSAVLSESLDYEQAAARVARMLVDRICDCVAVELLDKAGTELLCLARTPALQGVDLSQQTFGAAGVLAQGEPLHVRDIDAEACAALPAVCTLIGARSYSCIALRARGSSIGSLTLLSCAPRPPLEQGDRELAEELARRMSAAIDNARLYREAREAVATRDDVLAVVSHDLRSPLSAIGLTARRLRARDELTKIAGVERALALIDHSTTRMHGLVDELLEFAQVQAGRVTLSLKDVDMVTLIDEVCSMLEPEASTKSLQIVAEYPTHGRPFCRCDEPRIIRVLTNLVGNALKFSPEGGLITVRLECDDQNVSVAVSDMGPGISAVELPRLFESYWKGKRTGRNGIGLGLYISRGIVEAHGGTIRVRSQPPAGSTFQFSLPRTVEPPRRRPS